MKKNLRHRFPAFSWQQFRQNKPARVSLFVLLFFAVLALLAPVLSNHRPLYVQVDGRQFFPAFSLNKMIRIHDGRKVRTINLDITDWKQIPAERIVWAPIPYSPGKSDYLNANYVSPSGYQQFLHNGTLVEMPRHFRHWLGTGNVGEDVLASLIHGARISLTIGIVSMSLATLIGLIIGTVAGYFGDNRLFISRAQFLFLIPGIILGWFYGFRVNPFSFVFEMNSMNTGTRPLAGLLVFLFIVFLFSRLGRLLEHFRWMDKKVRFPVDAICSRLIEILVSLPVLLLVFAVAAVSKPSLLNVTLIIGCTAWTGIARLTRAEMLRIRELEYIQAAKALGYSTWRIIVKHALPNALAPAWVSISFGVANAILIESALSFIGIGIPPDAVTWGSLISSAHDNFNAWWMVVFPGICILVTVLAFNLVGEGLRDALDPRLRNRAS